jgi:hypothetical protein
LKLLLLIGGLAMLMGLLTGGALRAERQILKDCDPKDGGFTAGLTITPHQGYDSADAAAAGMLIRMKAPGVNGVARPRGGLLKVDASRYYGPRLHGEVIEPDIVIGVMKTFPGRFFVNQGMVCSQPSRNPMLEEVTP